MNVISRLADFARIYLLMEAGPHRKGSRESSLLQERIAKTQSAGGREGRRKRG